MLPVARFEAVLNAVDVFASVCALISIQDLIKSQMQQTMLKSASSGAKPEYSSTMDCVKTVMFMFFLLCLSPVLADGFWSSSVRF